MQSATYQSFRSVVVVTLLGLTSLAHAADSDSYVSAMRYVSLDVSGDNNDSRQYSGTGSFTIGRYVWLDGTLGKLKDGTDEGLGDLTNYGVGAGVKGEHLQFNLNYSHYKNDDAYVQRDVTAALDWIAKRYSFGLDAFRRSTDDAVSKTVTVPLGNTTIEGTAKQKLTGKGFGAHASINITDRLSVSLGGMGYSYDNDIRASTTVSSPSIPNIGPFLERTFTALLQRRLDSLSAGVTRDVTPLDNSYNAGISYLFDGASLSAQYQRDKILGSDSVTNTYMLGASFFVGDHWIVSPRLGTAKNDTAGDTTLGGLSVSYNW